MYTAGHQELQSNRWLQGHTGDRPSFDAIIARGFSGNRRFQVFAMTRGLLCLDKGKPISGSGSDLDTRAVVIGGVLGGALGAMVGAAVASNTPMGRAPVEPNYDLCSEDELLELARTRRRSFVAFYDDIKSISLNPPGFLARLLGDRSTAGYVKLRERKLGTVEMEIREASEMVVAIDTLPRRLGDRVQVKLQLDPRTRTFIPK
jgi:hypothetical protein